MHTFPTTWVERLLVLSAVLNPMLVMADVTPLASAPVTGHPAVPADQTAPSQIRSASQPSFVLETIRKRTVTTLAATRKQYAGIPARYTSRQPPILRAGAITPSIDDTMQSQVRTKLNLFIGPTQESLKPEISKNQQAGPAITSSYAPLSPLFPRNRPFIAMSAVPQLSATEYYRMNQATHEILHGGN